MGQRATARPSAVAGLVLGVLLLAPGDLLGDQARASVPAEPDRLLAEVLRLIPDVTTRSRALLLGKRDPYGESCAKAPVLEQADHRIRFPTDPQGGVGMRTTWVLASRLDVDDLHARYRWFQTDLRQYTGALRDANAVAQKNAERLAVLSRDLAAAIRAGRYPGTDIASGGGLQSAIWIGFCGASLADATAMADRRRTALWAAELEAATAHVADLHRWTAFLVGNQRDMLDFQVRCEALYHRDHPAWKVLADGTVPKPFGMPVGGLLKPMSENLLEVERQAERLFSVRRAYLERSLSGEMTARQGGAASVPAARWMPPDLRATFVRLRSVLSAKHQALWDEAAASPYDQSYLANMLWRLRAVDCLDAMAEVLRRFDARHDPGTREALMDVLFYRGEMNTGLRWDERFDPRLMEAAARLPGDTLSVLRQAKHVVHERFGGWANYDYRPDLRAALDDGRMDCLSATGMLTSLARNAGVGGLYVLRWTAGAQAHSTGAAAVRRGPKVDILVADGLDRPDAPLELWPWAFLRGHPWPDGWPGHKWPLFAFELYARGLDSYVWAEGYVAKGPEAGGISQASIPYLAAHVMPRIALGDPPPAEVRM